MLIVQICSSTS